MVALESSFIEVLAQIAINQVDITEGPEVKTFNTVGVYVAQGRLQIAKFVGGRGLEINIQSIRNQLIVITLVHWLDANIGGQVPGGAAIAE